MATGNPIILGGGIGKGTPFTLGSLLRVSNVTPPTAADSEVFQRTQGATEVITVGTPWTKTNTLTEKLQVVGGFISDTSPTAQNFVGGELQTVVSSANLRNVVLGFQAQCNALAAGAAVNTSLNVVITPITVVGATSGLRVGVGNCVLIGADPVWGTSFPGGNFTGVGTNLDIDVASTGPLVGAAAIGRGQGCAFGNFSGAQGNFNNWVCVGHSANINAANAMALGDGAQSSFTTSIALGRNATTLVANQLVVGGANLEINNVLIGGGDTAAVPTSLTWRNTDGSGSDITAGTMTVISSRGTGNAVGGGIELHAGVAGASGAALQAASIALKIQGGTKNIALWGAGTFGSGVGVMFLANATTNPSTNPTAGGILYVNGGALTYRGSGGTVTVIAPA